MTRYIVSARVVETVAYYVEADSEKQAAATVNRADSVELAGMDSFSSGDRLVHTLLSVAEDS